MQIIKLSKGSINAKNTKFVGFCISEEMYEDLTLLTIITGSSKSVILRNELIETLNSLTRTDRIAATAEKLFKLFQKKKQPWSIFSAKMFCVYIRNELIKIGISDNVLEDIFKKFHEFTKIKK